MVRPAVVSRIGVCRTTADRSGREMFAGLLTSRLVFLDAVGSDPTKPRKIPGALLVCWPLCPLQPASPAFAGRGQGGEVGESCGARHAPQCHGPGRLDAQFLLCEYASRWRPLDCAHRLLLLPAPRPHPPPWSWHRAVLNAHGLQPVEVGLHPAGMPARACMLAGVALCSRAATAR